MLRQRTRVQPRSHDAARGSRSGARSMLLRLGNQRLDARDQHRAADAAVQRGHLARRSRATRSITRARTTCASRCSPVRSCSTTIRCATASRCRARSGRSSRSSMTRTNELCATGYTMSQEDFLRQEEFVFGQHRTCADADPDHRAAIGRVVRRAGVIGSSQGRPGGRCGSAQRFRRHRVQAGLKRADTCVDRDSQPRAGGRERAPDRARRRQP